ncbi:MAG: FAD-binding oxidoreductase [Promethearchaeota archaeon]|nr:MAG: FAD-binding oxidoreductase [Candidatus Lokiarchaeota archaeon]
MARVKDAYKEIEDVIGSEYISDKDYMKAAYSRNVDPAFPDRWADMIVRPETPEEISEIVKISNKYKIQMVPRGGGADLVGGSVTQGGILIDLTRMNQIIEINEDDFYCEVECGITWGNLISELHLRGLTTGVLGPGSGYSATIGGGLSNATVGFGSTKYGTVPDVCLGVEVVLPNPEGTIIRTGSAASKYATPFCRYGLAPDFTGLFMGDVGTLGIKTKAFMKLFPNAPYKTKKDYMMNKNDFNKVFQLMHKLKEKVGDGLHDCIVVPFTVVKFLAGMAEEKPEKRPRIKGAVFNLTLEAFDERILEIYVEQVEEIMKDDARTFDWQEIDLSLESSKDWKFTLQYAYNYFNKYISIQPPKVSCTTCHKVPISFLEDAVKQSIEFDSKFKNEFPPESLSLFATCIFLVPNGNCVLVGGFNADNVDEQREIAMSIWHKRLRHQVRYGAIHYWLGESISQSIVEADAYTPEFIKFFKDIKKTVDPNFLLSPKKFHMYSYDDDITKHVVKDEKSVRNNQENDI